jgi:hypothetical protein
VVTARFLEQFICPAQAIRARSGIAFNADFPPVLAKLTSRNANQPLVFLCEGAKCWESYNAALRATDQSIG